MTDIHKTDGSFDCDHISTANGIPDRSKFDTEHTIRYIWKHLGLPESSLRFALPDKSAALPSSFKIGHLAQASIALSALAAASVDALHNNALARKVTVPLRHAGVEFDSEKHYFLDGRPAESGWGPLGGLHQTADGYIRMHDSFPNHRKAACDLLGLNEQTATREDVAEKLKHWRALEIEDAAMKNNAVIYALRSYQEWDRLPQAKSVPSFPIFVRKISDEGPKGLPSHMPKAADRCLRGLRVIDFTRVIAGPVAGKTLAAHGADVIWVTSPNLLSQPALDIDVQRGKRTIRLDLKKAEDLETLRGLAKNADVFLQSYRPGSFAAKELGPEDLAKLRPGIIYASLNAWGNEGPWAHNRGFDSIVQTVSGMNVSEAEHFGTSPAKAMPAQALDHAAGYLLATGISAALYKRATEGGSWEVTVSLAGVMKYLRSLGQHPGRSGFECAGLAEGELESFLEERETGFGTLRAVSHSAQVEGKEPGWDVMPKPLGSDEARWSRDVGSQIHAAHLYRRTSH
ncbi:Acetyl-coenzyme A transferase nodX [Pseudocercospora fuligena]|uniref:Acetyl-coenzyme A transferase nodX n=1 Tax=Pseudocercospora fuligena TaxID=685502 RepID=A0A8H6RT60_9PEZI|nr:Acetyl-coenzyme A transferase nodX [Pseudocercospora fuligena]